LLIDFEVGSQTILFTFSGQHIDFLFNNSNIEFNEKLNRFNSKRFV